MQSEMCRAKSSSAKGGNKEVFLRSSHYFSGSHEWQNDSEICKTSSVRRYLKVACLSGVLAVVTPYPWTECVRLWLVAAVTVLLAVKEQ